MKLSSKTWIARLHTQSRRSEESGSSGQASGVGPTSTLSPIPYPLSPKLRYLLIAALLCLAAFAGHQLTPVSAQDQDTGLTTRFQQQNGEQILVIDSPGRFELQLDQSG